MVSLFFFSLVLLNGLCAALNHHDAKLHNDHLNRISRANENERVLQNSMKKLLNVDINEMRSADDEKQQYDSSNTDKAAGSVSADSFTQFPEDVACLEACYVCVDDHSLILRKKRSIDGCGPICECANSCSRISIEQIDKIYGQDAARRGDRDCFLRTYLQMIDNEVQLSH
ncbi:unnamed protein product [Rotaria socialis]|uniref:Uncharacterized protein n=1 Tax=Rotaria socialis TaxID=392032 RepID=A0A817QE48_9BILA|nr:unnamed protein product [Rotaria socialis]CAF3444174.1 unnamed protein product [Rotaria socialis]CAF3485974.1 unnamed protein product [Rotaria socialis]CAF3636377.1 unnamed protein product [Rotaria socialis]CAF3654936.1 unnamed protein product [Rotaria socialis]